jgi:hypothetical protein
MVHLPRQVENIEKLILFPSVNTSVLYLSSIFVRFSIFRAGGSVLPIGHFYIKSLQQIQVALAGSPFVHGGYVRKIPKR